MSLVGNVFYDCNEVVGYLFGKKITRKEADENPEIWGKIEFKTVDQFDWTCAYCRTRNNQGRDECHYCYAPRREYWK